MSLSNSKTVMRLVFKDKHSLELKYPDGKKLPDIYKYEFIIPANDPVAKWYDENNPPMPEEAQVFVFSRLFKLELVENAAGWRYAHYREISR
jgi:hypothetical protein